MSENRLVEALLTGKPYFGPAMCALQGPPNRHRYLGALVEEVAKSRRQGQIRILELGSWAGASAITWGKAIQGLGSEGRVTCVDQWRPYFDESLETEFHYQAMNDAGKDGKILKLFLHNIRTANVSHMVDYLIGDTREVLPGLSGAEYDIVYIDGSHIFEFVRRDIKEAKRLVREGGIICGDDLELQRSEVDDVEHTAAVDLKKDFVHSCRADAYYHPGVTEAVAIEFGLVSSWEGVWAARKLASQWARIKLDAATVRLPDHIQHAVEAQAEEERHTAGEILDTTNDFHLVKVDKRFLAVAKRLGPVKLFTERLGERDLAPLLFLSESLDAVRQRALAFEKETAVPSVKLVDDTGRYNIVRAEDRFLAIAKDLGPVNLYGERLGERDLASLLFSGESLDAVREKVLSVEKENAVPSVELIDEIGRYNIVKAENRFIAVAKVLGPVDLFRERVGERDLPPLILVATDSTVLRHRILQMNEKSTKDQDLS
jgi:predicted O-methyltransferase YrrM